MAAREKSAVTSFRRPLFTPPMRMMSVRPQNVDEANRHPGTKPAGFRGSDGVREKNGVRLSILYQTSTNSVRQGTQAFIKEMWKAIGVETELRNLSASVFFGGDPGSPDTYQKFYADIEMYTNNFSGTDPETYMANWTCKQVSRTSKHLGWRQYATLVQPGLRCALR